MPQYAVCDIRPFAELLNLLAVCTIFQVSKTIHTASIIVVIASHGTALVGIVGRPP